MSLNVVNTVRAWKDEMYRKRLSSEEQAMLPVCPAGALELTDADLEAVQGGWGNRFSGCRCRSIFGGMGHGGFLFGFF
ncbi:MAG: mersacidin/lichenicidin family type 2 lantibiotic [Chloroflexi bacterium]|nr:MAG: mersacidin/lichenicidin family type 2 lantibiotic [Chloroflexota bacterium]